MIETQARPARQLARLVASIDKGAMLLDALDVDVLTLEQQADLEEHLARAAEHIGAALRRAEQA